MHCAYAATCSFVTRVSVCLRELMKITPNSSKSLCTPINELHSCQPVMTKKRDKILKKVGFSVKKRDKLKILDKNG